MTATNVRRLSAIAHEATVDWNNQKGGIYFGAKPYLNAMYSLEDAN